MAYASFGVVQGIKKQKRSLCRDSNPESLAPEASALSIRPQRPNRRPRSEKVPLRPREGSICCLDRSVIDEACEIAIRTLKLFYPIFTSSPIFGSVAARRRDGAGVVAFGRAHMVSL